MPTGIYKRTDEHRRKISVGMLGNPKVIQAQIGKKLSDEHRKKIGLSNFKGGITPLSMMIRNLPEYHNWRNLVFKRDHYTCQKCGVNKNLEANHRKQFSFILSDFLLVYSRFSPVEDKETLLKLAMDYQPFWDLSNGETFCKQCHMTIKIIR